MGFRPRLGEDGKPVESVDELPPWRHLIPLACSNVLATYASTVAVLTKTMSTATARRAAA